VVTREQYSGGEGGIRTPDTVARMPHFECGAFNRSATSPGTEMCNVCDVSRNWSRSSKIRGWPDCRNRRKLNAPLSQSQRVGISTPPPDGKAAGRRAQTRFICATQSGLCRRGGGFRLAGPRRPGGEPGPVPREIPGPKGEDHLCPCRRRRSLPPYLHRRPRLAEGDRADLGRLFAQLAPYRTAMASTIAVDDDDLVVAPAERGRATTKRVLPFTRRSQ
jgi:hypothetical protein